MKNSIKTKFLLIGLFLFALGCRKTGNKPVESTNVGIVISRSNLTLRADPSVSGKFVATLKPGEKIMIESRSPKIDKIYGQESSWLKVRHGSLSGWAFGGFIFEIDEAPTDSAALIAFESTWSPDYPPAIILTTQGKFLLRCNDCHEMYDLKGKYRREGDLFTLESEIPKDFPGYPMKMRKVKTGVDEFLTDIKTCSPKMNTIFVAAFEHGV